MLESVQPGVVRERTRDLVHDMGPHVPALVDLLDDLEPLADAVPPSNETLLRGDDPRVARGVPDRVLDLRIELVDPAARVEEEPNDDRGADDPGAGDERGPTIQPAHLPETGEEPAAAAIRLASRPLRHPGQKIDFDHGLPLVRAHACRSARPTGSISMGAS